MGERKEMGESALTEAYRSLELPHDALPSQVEVAFRRKEALYGEDALATYSLMEPDLRREMLERHEAACRQIVAGRNRVAIPCVAAAPPEPAANVDPAASPGRFLQLRREAAGLTLREVAGRTKISPMKLRQIEEERYNLLPAHVYLRGFVLAYARAVGLPDPEGVARLFLDRHRDQVAET